MNFKKQKIITIEEAEVALAVIIDILYIKTKTNFVDYKEKTHKLGFFKEAVKSNFHFALKHIKNDKNIIQNSKRGKKRNANS